MFAAAGLALFLFVAAITAKEYKGTLTKVEGDTVKIKIGDDEKTFLLTDKTDITNVDGDKIEKDKVKAGKKGKGVTIVTEEKDDKEVEKDGKLILKSMKLQTKK
jgi:hypothetical protein